MLFTHKDYGSGCWDLAVLDSNEEPVSPHTLGNDFFDILADEVYEGDFCGEITAETGKSYYYDIRCVGLRNEELDFSDLDDETLDGIAELVGCGRVAGEL